MSESLGVSVIGLGMMGQRHARIWKELPATELVSVYDIMPERTEELARRLDTRPARSLEEALNTPGCGAVSICTDDQAHVEPCLVAAREGKHILLEKPLATTLADADMIIEGCEEHGVTLMVGHVVRFDPRYQAAKAAVEAGEVGEIVQVYARRNNIIASGRRIGPRTSVTCFLGVHDLDLMCWVSGAAITQVYAQSARKVLAEIGADDTVFSLLRFDNGAVGCLETCWVIPEGQPNTLDARLEVVGDRGRVAVRVGDESVEIVGPQQARRPDIAYGPEVAGLQHGALRTQLEHFAGCLKNGTPPLVTVAEARAAVAACAAIEKSLECGCRVEL